MWVGLIIWRPHSRVSLFPHATFISLDNYYFPHADTGLYLYLGLCNMVFYKLIPVVELLPVAMMAAVRSFWNILLSSLTIFSPIRLSLNRMFCSRASWIVWIPHKFCSHMAIIQWSIQLIRMSPLLDGNSIESTKLMVGIWTIKERMSTKSITCHLGKSMQSLRFVGLAGWRHLLNQVTRPSFLIFFFFKKTWVPQVGT